MLYKNKPTIGLVIGTYASAPHIHLQLEARKRFYPNIPVLIHDDGSKEHRSLLSLCKQYGAEFHCQTTRAPVSPNGLGDLSAFVQGLMWAKRIDVDMLVKFSRRWIVLKDWASELQQLAIDTQFPTYSSYCKINKYDFRTECTAMHVDSWYNSDFIEESIETIEKKILPFPEGHVHEHSKKISNEYGMWNLLGTSKFDKRENCLWHDSNTVNEYREKMLEFGFDYKDWNV